MIHGWLEVHQSKPTGFTVDKWCALHPVPFRFFQKLPAFDFRASAGIREGEIYLPPELYRVHVRVPRTSYSPNDDHTIHADIRLLLCLPISAYWDGSGKNNWFDDPYIMVHSATRFCPLASLTLPRESVTPWLQVRTASCVLNQTGMDDDSQNCFICFFVVRQPEGMWSFIPYLGSKLLGIVRFSGRDLDSLAIRAAGIGWSIRRRFLP